MSNNCLHRVRLDHVVWQPQKGKEPVLNNISLEFFEGEFYGMLGPNGAGKTSLVRQILRLQKPDQGAIWLDQENLRAWDRDALARKLAFLPQTIREDVDFTVWDTVAMGREPYRKRFFPLEEKDREVIRQALEMTDCLKLKDKRVSILSGGERQRVILARTIAQDTPWVILDEPVSNLDVRHQIEIMGILKELQEQGKTIIAILHDMNLAAAFCTKIVIMKEGSVYAFGPVQEVLTERNLEEVYGMKFEFLEGRSKNGVYIVPQV